MSAEPRRSLPALTGARFFAATAVVLYHYGQEALGALSPALQRLACAGPSAVSFFYVLSGAVLTWGCTGEEGIPTRSRGRFWSARAAKILPAYLLALALALPPFAAHEWLRFHAGALPRVALGLLACLSLLQAWIPQASAGLNTPGWSISCEAFFYALWPALVARLRSAKRGFPWARVLGLFALSLLPPLATTLWLKSGAPLERTFETLTGREPLPELLGRFLSYFPLLRLPEFLIGIALGHALRASAHEPRAENRAADTARELLLLFILFAAAWMLGAGLPARITGVPLFDRIAIEGPGLSLFFALWIWQLARGRGLLARLLATPKLLALGEASYAIYILQAPLVVWCTAALKRVAPSLFARWPIVFWLWFAALIAASLAVHRWIELPLRDAWLRRSRSAR